MQYLVKFVYMDDRVRELTMPHELLKEFFESLNKKEVYWNRDESQGFWTDLDKIRQVEFYAQNNGKVEKISANKALKSEDGCEEVSEEALRAATVETVSGAAGA